MRFGDRKAQAWLNVDSFAGRASGRRGDPERYDEEEGYDGPPAVTSKPDPFKPVPEDDRAG